MTTASRKTHNDGLQLLAPLWMAALLGVHGRRASHQGSQSFGPKGLGGMIITPCLWVRLVPLPAILR